METKKKKTPNAQLAAIEKPFQTYFTCQWSVANHEFFEIWFHMEYAFSQQMYVTS